MITCKSLPRRALLRGLGAGITLPFLDAMVPALAGKNAPKPSLRLGFVYVPNGIDMPNWTPVSVGTGFELPHIVEPLARHRERLLMLTGLAQVNGRALGDGPGDHARAAASYLTGVHPKKTAGTDIQNGISVDQVAAQVVGSETKFPSLELGCEHGSLAGNCDSGYSCAYTNSLSWRGSTTPNPPEVNPRLLFERLFGVAGEDPAGRARRLQYEKSILDFVQEDTKQLMSGLGTTDRRKLDEYLAAVREIERRIEASERASADAPPAPEPFLERPAGIPVEFQDHARLMLDLMAVAFQTNSTRVATFMVGREGSNRSYGEIGVPEAHHGLSHHQNDPEKIARIRKINRFHVEQFAYFLERLASIPDGDSSLLDHVLIVYGSGLSDGNRHTHHDLPVLLAGGACGTLRAGRHLIYPKETPMNNLFVSLLDRMGVRVETLGDSNGKLNDLSDLT